MYPKNAIVIDLAEWKRTHQKMPRIRAALVLIRKEPPHPLRWMVGLLLFLPAVMDIALSRLRGLWYDLLCVTLRLQDEKESEPELSILRRAWVRTHPIHPYEFSVIPVTSDESAVAKLDRLHANGWRAFRLDEAEHEGIPWDTDPYVVLMRLISLLPEEIQAEIPSDMRRHFHHVDLAV